MLALLKNINITFVQIGAGAAFVFFMISVIICLVLIARRVLRNRIKNNELIRKGEFESEINKALTPEVQNAGIFKLDLKYQPIFNEVLLKYFRILNGERSNTLKTIIKRLNIEPQIRKSTQVGTVGRRMEAMQVLSYLDTQSSLVSIEEGLSSTKKYIRLTAARCLIRRKADVFIDNIVTSIDSAFPDDPKILADILYRFGAKIAPELEAYVSMSKNDNIQTACLEAMVLLMPPSTSLDLERLMDSSNEHIRAATVSLSQVTSYQSTEDILTLALADPATSVKIRAAKIANASKRSDTISLLYKLTQDPLLWVRYWSTLAIYNTGRQGQKLVESIARGDGSSAHMAREVVLERSLQLGQT